MQTERLNTTHLVRTAIVLLLVVLGTVFLHRLQMARHARNQVALAEEAFAANQPTQVIAALSRSLRFEPNNPAVRTRYAMALTEQASTPRERWRALQVLRQAMGNDIALRLRAAELAASLDEPNEAVKYLEPLLKLEPKNAELREQLARYQLEAGKVQAAVENLEAACVIDPSRISAAQLLAQTQYAQLGNRALADAALDRLVRENPKLAQARVVRARWRMQFERLDAAEADLVMARQLAPHDAEVLSASAELADRQGNLEQACQYWQEAVRERPNDLALSLGLAREQRDCGRLEAALATLQAIHKHHPQDIETSFRLAELLIDTGQLKQAEQIQAKLPQPEAKGRALFLAAKIAQRQRHWLDAAKWYVEAIQCSDIDPEQGSRLMMELARCYGALGARDEQFVATMQAARLARTHRTRLQLSEMLLAAGRGEDALPLLRSLAKLPTPPRDTWGLLARALLDQHRTQPTRQRRWREVEEALEKAADDPQQAVPSAVVRAEMLWLRNDSRAARKLLEATLKEHPKEAVLYLALADLYTRNGDEAEARAVLTRGDRALGNDLDWLLARAGRLAGHRGIESHQELQRLEQRGDKLADEPRDQYLRYLAELHARLDHSSDVERLTRRILARHPNDLRARLLLVDALLAQGDEAGAKRVISELHRIEGDGGSGWRCATVALRLAEARRGQRSGLVEARQLIQEIDRIRPNWSQTAFLTARLADTEGKTDAALTHYQQVLERGDYHPVALTRLVQLLGEKNRWNEAATILEQARSRSMLDPEFLRPTAWVAVKAGQFERASELARLAVPESNRAFRDWLWLGRLLDAAERPTEAGDAFERAIRLAPDAPEVWLARIHQLARRKRFAEADALLIRMKSALSGERYELTLAQAQEALGRFAEAEQTYRRLLDRQPHDAETLRRLTQLLIRVNKPIQAEQVLLQLFHPKVALSEEEIPDLRRIYALLVTAPEQSKDRVDEALKILGLNGESDTDQRIAMLVRGRRAKERDEALRSLERLDSWSERSPLEQLRLAQLYHAQGQWNCCREILLRLLADDERNPGLLAALIEGLLRQNKRTEAQTWLEKLQQIEPDSSRVQKFLKW